MCPSALVVTQPLWWWPGKGHHYIYLDIYWAYIASERFESLLCILDHLWPHNHLYIYIYIYGFKNKDDVTAHMNDVLFNEMWMVKEWVKLFFNLYISTFFSSCSLFRILRKTTEHVCLGIGKTTIIKSVCNELKSHHKVTLSGFYTEEVKEGRVRKGFDVVTMDGDRSILARKRLDYSQIVI